MYTATATLSDAPIALLIITSLLAYISYCVVRHLHCGSGMSKSTAGGRAVSTMVIFGSGGHTTEMLHMIRFIMPSLSSVCLSVCLSVHPHVFSMSTSMPACQFVWICVPVYLSIFVTLIYPYICDFVWMYVSLSVRLIDSLIPSHSLSDSLTPSLTLHSLWSGTSPSPKYHPYTSWPPTRTKRAWIKSKLSTCRMRMSSSGRASSGAGRWSSPGEALCSLSHTPSCKQLEWCWCVALNSSSAMAREHVCPSVSSPVCCALCRHNTIAPDWCLLRVFVEWRACPSPVRSCIPWPTHSSCSGRA